MGNIPLPTCIEHNFPWEVGYFPYIPYIRLVFEHHINYLISDILSDLKVAENMESTEEIQQESIAGVKKLHESTSEIQIESSSGVETLAESMAEIQQESGPGVETLDETMAVINQESIPGVEAVGDLVAAINKESIPDVETLADLVAEIQQEPSPGVTTLDESTAELPQKSIHGVKTLESSCSEDRANVESTAEIPRLIKQEFINDETVEIPRLIKQEFINDETVESPRLIKQEFINDETVESPRLIKQEFINDETVESPRLIKQEFINDETVESPRLIKQEFINDETVESPRLIKQEFINDETVESPRLIKQEFINDETVESPRLIKQEFINDETVESPRLIKQEFINDETVESPRLIKQEFINDETVESPRLIKQEFINDETVESPRLIKQEFINDETVESPRLIKQEFINDDETVEIPRLIKQEFINDDETVEIPRLIKQEFINDETVESSQSLQEGLDQAQSNGNVDSVSANESDLTDLDHFQSNGNVDSVSANESDLADLDHFQSNWNVDSVSANESDLADLDHFSRLLPFCTPIDEHRPRDFSKYIKCSAWNCLNTADLIRTMGMRVSFHRFPDKDREPERFAAWVKNCRAASSQLKRTSVVCSVHFEPELISIGTRHNVISEDAVPTIFSKEPRLGQIFDKAEVIQKHKAQDAWVSVFGLKRPRLDTPNPKPKKKKSGALVLYPDKTPAPIDVPQQTSTAPKPKKKKSGALILYPDKTPAPTDTPQQKSTTPGDVGDSGSGPKRPRVDTNLSSEPSLGFSKKKKNKGTQCFALNCRNKKSAASNAKGISYHKFPNRDKEPARFYNWLKNVGRPQIPSTHAVLCSAHFEEKDIYRLCTKPQLRPGAIPTIFYDNDEVDFKIKSIRKYINESRVRRRAVYVASKEEKERRIDPSAKSGRLVLYPDKTPAPNDAPQQNTAVPGSGRLVLYPDKTPAPNDAPQQNTAVPGLGRLVLYPDRTPAPNDAPHQNTANPGPGRLVLYPLNTPAPTDVPQQNTAKPGSAGVSCNAKRVEHNYSVPQYDPLRHRYQKLLEKHKAMRRDLINTRNRLQRAKFTLSRQGTLEEKIDELKRCKIELANLRVARQDFCGGNGPNSSYTRRQRDFAETLLLISPEAYTFLRDIAGLNLPHQRSLRKWIKEKRDKKNAPNTSSNASRKQPVSAASDPEEELNGHVTQTKSKTPCEDSLYPEVDILENALFSDESSPKYFCGSPSKVHPVTVSPKKSYKSTKETPNPTTDKDTLYVILGQKIRIMNSPVIKNRKSKEKDDLPAKEVPVPKLRSLLNTAVAQNGLTEGIVNVKGTPAKDVHLPTSRRVPNTIVVQRRQAKDIVQDKCVPVKEGQLPKPRIVPNRVVVQNYQNQKVLDSSGSSCKIVAWPKHSILSGRSILKTKEDFTTTHDKSASPQSVHYGVQVTNKVSQLKVGTMKSNRNSPIYVPTGKPVNPIKSVKLVIGETRTILQGNSQQLQRVVFCDDAIDGSVGSTRRFTSASLEHTNKQNAQSVVDESIRKYPELIDLTFALMRRDQLEKDVP